MRFNTDRALFDAFPTARDHIKTEPADAPPAVFLRDLVKAHKFDEALSFCAYLLARREAVAWGCRCLRARRREEAGAGAPPSPALDAAEAWAQAPSDERRLVAHDRWTTGDREDPATWLALAAAWSGGAMMPGLANSPAAAPHLTATMVRVATILALHRVPAAGRPPIVQDWIGAGLRLAETGL